MPYLNLDDGMDEHPKIEPLTDAAFRLHLSAMFYAARQMTDGYIPHSKARRLTISGKDATAAELVRAGVWHDLGEGCDDPDCIERRTCPEHGKPRHYLIHDWLQWNHSRAWWTDRRRAEAERKRKARARRGADAATPDGVDPTSRARARRRTEYGTDAGQEDGQTP